MKTVLKYIVLGIVLLSITFLTFIFVGIHVYYGDPKPSKHQLEKSCGVKFPSFSSTIDQTAIEGHISYVVKFNGTLSQKVVEQINYLCQNGELLDDDFIGLYNPWTLNDGCYTFYLDNVLYNSDTYTLPLSCRSIRIKVDKSLDGMHITYWRSEL